ncbi:MAG: flagellar hook-length control protein FliK [Pseudomonadota bacterium]
MHIQQLMSLANGPEAGSQSRAGAPADGGAFASTLARAAEGSDRLLAAARHAPGDGVSAAGREALSELRQALRQGDQQALEALTAERGGALSEALAQLQQQLVQAGHRPAGAATPDGLAQALPAQSRARPAQAGDAAPDADPTVRNTHDDLASLVSRLQERLEQAGAGQSGSEPAATQAADGLASLMAQLQQRLEQAGAAPSESDPAATQTADGLASLLEQLQQHLDTAGDRTANGGREGLPATDGLAGLLTQLQARLEQASGRAPSDPESLTALQQRLALIQQAGRQSAAGSAAIDNGRAEIPRGTETPTPPATIAANDAARHTQAAVERSLAEQAQALRQVTGDSTSTPTPRQPDAIAEALLASRQEAPRVGSGMSQPGGEPTGNGLGTASPPLSAGTNGAGATAAAATATASLSAPVGTAAWNQQLGQQLMRISQQGGEQRVQLKLHPAELGPLSVSLTFSDQGAQAQFLSGHAQVRQALEQAIPQLRETLAEQGISLGEASVGEQRTGHDDGPARQPGEMLAASGLDDGGEELPGAGDTMRHRDLALDGRVDLYA